MLMKPKQHLIIVMMRKKNRKNGDLNANMQTKSINSETNDNGNVNQQEQRINTTPNFADKNINKKKMQVMIII